jgi:hypothetical protein
VIPCNSCTDMQRHAFTRTIDFTISLGLGILLWTVRMKLR